jgi:hypothetical protein
LAAGAGAPFGQPEIEGLYKEPIQRYVEVQYDFLALPPATPLFGMPLGSMTPTAPPLMTPTAPGEAVPVPPPPAIPEAAPALPPPPPGTPEDASALPPPPTPPAPPVQLALGPAQVGGKSFPSLCLHPEGVQQATAAFPATTIRPVAGEWPRTLLLFRVGLADPVVPPEAEQAKPGPLVLTVTFGDHVIHTEEVTDRKWAFRAVDVTALAGQTGDMTFRASTLNPDERLSVLCLGEPMLVEEQGIYYLRPGGRSLAFGFSLTNFPQGTPGLALAQVESAGDAAVDLSIGDATEHHLVTAGTHWLPLTFAKPGRFAFKASGDVKFLRLDAAPFTPAPHFQPQPEAQPATK